MYRWKVSIAGRLSRVEVRKVTRTHVINAQGQTTPLWDDLYFKDFVSAKRKALEIVRHSVAEREEHLAQAKARLETLLAMEEEAM
jgi:hypothetical protein